LKTDKEDERDEKEEQEMKVIKQEKTFFLTKKPQKNQKIFLQTKLRDCLKTPVSSLRTASLHATLGAGCAKQEATEAKRSSTKLI
jgi:hypothetical protein